MQYKGVFFDFDYTLADSTAAILRGFQAGFAAMGLPAPTEEQVRPTVGMTLADAYLLLTGDTDPERAQTFYHQFQLAVGKLAGAEGTRLMVEGTVLLPGAVDLIAGLKGRGAAVAVVSTKLSLTIRRIFAYNRLEVLPDLIVGGEDVLRNKPDPEGLLYAVSTLGLRPEEVLYCGDTVIDAQTAANAGTAFAAVLNGTTPAQAFASYPSVTVAPNLPVLSSFLGLEQPA